MRIQTLNPGTRDEQTIYRTSTGHVIAVSRKRRPVEWRWVIACVFVGAVIGVTVFGWLS